MTDTETTGIRSYGLGKFDTILDSYVYQVSLDGGPDEECGDSSMGAGWFGLLRDGKTIFRDHDPLLETLTEEEQETLTSCAGVIISESSDGFVDCEYFDTDTELETAWAAILADNEETEETEEN